jgi:uncharacterized membrane protein
MASFMVILNIKEVLGRMIPYLPYSFVLLKMFLADIFQS